MGLPRLILLAIVIGGGIWLWRRFAGRTAPLNKDTAAQSMVRCAHCNVHLPQDRAIKRDQNWFCSSEHLQKGAQPRD